MVVCEWEFIWYLCERWAPLGCGPDHRGLRSSLGSTWPQLERRGSPGGPWPAGSPQPFSRRKMEAVLRPRLPSSQFKKIKEEALFTKQERSWFLPELFLTLGCEELQNTWFSFLGPYQRAGACVGVGGLWLSPLWPRPRPHSCLFLFFVSTVVCAALARQSCSVTGTRNQIHKVQGTCLGPTQPAAEPG